ncbi:hypothetical protein SAMN04487950_2828 [Halogranum rubrum]|uniref:Uncharacterized protein n=1 Tax=Halogranum rubrum TaxID=553466 RepID=A0A1I4FGC6_9EURY|nr:hypothetical protein [Halogranum rubrum]SFL16519.1 hypothetical protein SAMN04487950_2828 [Halogranum rubrum]
MTALQLLAPAMLRAVAQGSLAGWLYLAVVVGTMHRLYLDFSVWERRPTSFGEVIGYGYFYGGLWLVGALSTTLFLGAGAVLPLAVVVCDYFLLVGNPHVGDSIGPPGLFLWPIYLPVFLVLGGVEYGSLLLVRDGPTVLTLGRHALVGLLALAIAGYGLSFYLPLWRVVPTNLSLPIQIENNDDVAHDVTVSVVDIASDETVFTKTLYVGAGERITVDDAVTRLRRYRVVGTLEGEASETTDDYTFEPRRRASVRGVVVWVDGELGRFAVIGQGTGP